jgi:hypothetical protein
MEAYAGFEPQVGEIRAVRTFRVGEGGLLYPLFSSVPWHPGENVAHCRLPVQAGGVSHAVPDPDCSCGFYAYATADAAAEYPHARHVLAVVACWGHVIAGTRGLRTEHARVEAIWMSPAVPRELVAQVTRRYADTTIYADRDQMLTQHPPTPLDCYQPTPTTSRFGGRFGVRPAAVTIGAVLGLLPASWITGNLDVLLVWLLALLYFAVGATILSRRRLDPGARRHAAQFFAVLLWLVAPLAGPAGILFLRIPLLQLTAIVLAQRWRMARLAATFPAVIS